MQKYPGQLWHASRSAPILFDPAPPISFHGVPKRAVTLANLGLLTTRLCFPGSTSAPQGSARVFGGQQPHECFVMTEGRRIRFQAIERLHLVWPPFRGVRHGNPWRSSGLLGRQRTPDWRRLRKAVGSLLQADRSPGLATLHNWNCGRGSTNASRPSSALWSQQPGSGGARMGHYF